MKRKNYTRRNIKIYQFLFAVCFLWYSIFPYAALADDNRLSFLPPVGEMVKLSSQYTPTVIKGITLFKEDPFRFDFIIDAGEENLNDNAFQEEANKLIKYFLASLTLPEEELWVNLSPYEENRIIPSSLGAVEMGRDLLAQDYILKQLASSLMYPEEDLGEKFWNRVYEKAKQNGEMAQLQTDTFNKVWIIPDQANIIQHEKGAFIVSSHLKVMMEEDYFAMKKAASCAGLEDSKNLTAKSSTLTSDTFKNIIVPQIEKEVNEGKLFANLRQIFNSMILATWYKQNLKKSILSQIYVDQNKASDLKMNDEEVIQNIYAQYVTSFQKGVFNYIKEDYIPETQQIIPRKYFSGGINAKLNAPVSDGTMDFALATNTQRQEVIDSLAGKHDFRNVSINLSPTGNDAEKVLNAIATIGSDDFALASKPDITGDNNKDPPAYVRPKQTDLGKIPKEYTHQTLHGPYYDASKHVTDHLIAIAQTGRQISKDDLRWAITEIANAYKLNLLNDTKGQQQIENQLQSLLNEINSSNKGSLYYTFPLVFSAMLDQQALSNGNAGYANIYFPRDMAYGLPSEKGITAMKTATTSPGLFHLSRASFGSENYSWASGMIDMLASQTKTKDKFLSEFANQITLRMQHNPGFRKKIEEIEGDLKKAGYFDKTHIRFIDTGFKTFPLFMQALIKRNNPKIVTEGLVMAADSSVVNILPQFNKQSWQEEAKKAIEKNPDLSQYAYASWGPMEDAESTFLHPMKYNTMNNQISPTSLSAHLVTNMRSIQFILGAINYHRLVNNMSIDLINAKNMSQVKAEQISKNTINTVLGVVNGTDKTTGTTVTTLMTNVKVTESQPKKILPKKEEPQKTDDDDKTLPSQGPTGKTAFELAFESAEAVKNAQAEKNAQQTIAGKIAAADAKLKKGPEAYSSKEPPSLASFLGAPESSKELLDKLLFSITKVSLPDIEKALDTTPDSIQVVADKMKMLDIEFLPPNFKKIFNVQPLTIENKADLLNRLQAANFPTFDKIELLKVFPQIKKITENDKIRYVVAPDQLKFEYKDLKLDGLIDKTEKRILIKDYIQSSPIIAKTMPRLKKIGALILGTLGGITDSEYASQYVSDAINQINQEEKSKDVAGLTPGDTPDIFKMVELQEKKALLEQVMAQINVLLKQRDQLENAFDLLEENQLSTKLTGAGQQYIEILEQLNELNNFHDSLNIDIIKLAKAAPVVQKAQDHLQEALAALKKQVPELDAFSDGVLEDLKDLAEIKENIDNNVIKNLGKKMKEKTFTEEERKEVAIVPLLTRTSRVKKWLKILGIATAILLIPTMLDDQAPPIYEELIPVVDPSKIVSAPKEWYKTSGAFGNLKPSSEPMDYNTTNTYLSTIAKHMKEKMGDIPFSVLEGMENKVMSKVKKTPYYLDERDTIYYDYYFKKAIERIEDVKNDFDSHELNAIEAAMGVYEYVVLGKTKAKLTFDLPMSVIDNTGIDQGDDFALATQTDKNNLFNSRNMRQSLLNDEFNDIKSIKQLGGAERYTRQIPDSEPLLEDIGKRGIGSGSMDGTKHNKFRKKGADSDEIWMFKKPPAHRMHRVLVDEFITGLSRRIGIETVQESYAGRIGNEFGSFNKWFNFVNNEKKDWSLRPLVNKYRENFPAHLTREQLITIVQEQVMDWLVSNHDSHSGHFMIDPNGKIVTIDKSQAFKYLGQSKERLSTDYDPNEVYNGKNNRFYMPVYNTVLKSIAKGGTALSLSDARQEVQKVIEKIKEITPEEYIQELTPYAIFRFDIINSDEDKQTGLDRYTFLDLATERLLSIEQDFNKFYADLSEDYAQPVTRTDELDPNKVGGIDLNPNALKMNIQGNAPALDVAEPKSLNVNFDIDGFRPIIIDVKPIPNVQMILGLNK